MAQSQTVSVGRYGFCRPRCVHPWPPVYFGWKGLTVCVVPAPPTGVVETVVAVGSMAVAGVGIYLLQVDGEGLVLVEVGGLSDLGDGVDPVPQLTVVVLGLATVYLLYPPGLVLVEYDFPYPLAVVLFY